MPRVRRTPPVRLAVPVESVRAAAIDHLSGTALDGDTVRLPVADQALGGVFVDLVLRADGPASTLVATETQGQIDIPFFRWAFRPLVAVSKRRTRRYAIAWLRSEFEGTVAPEPPTGVIGLPTATFTDAKGDEIQFTPLCASL